MDMFFHILCSIEMKDFVTLQVHIFVVSHRYLTKYKCALFVFFKVILEAF